MKKTDATPMDCIVCECPYCGKEVIELNGDLRDFCGSDIEQEGEIDCPHCKKTFKYEIED
jgi:transposase-like protein